MLFCKLQDPGLAAEWEPKQAVSHQLSEHQPNAAFHTLLIKRVLLQRTPLCLEKAPLNEFIGEILHGAQFWKDSLQFEMGR